MKIEEKLKKQEAFVALAQTFKQAVLDGISDAEEYAAPIKEPVDSILEIADKIEAGLKFIGSRKKTNNLTYTRKGRDGKIIISDLSTERSLQNSDGIGTITIEYDNESGPRISVGGYLANRGKAGESYHTDHFSANDMVIASILKRIAYKASLDKELESYSKRFTSIRPQF